MSAELYTVGHSARPIEGLLDVLTAAGISSVVDVRAYPVSRRHPHLSRTPLERHLAASGITYVWSGAALGGFRKPRADSLHHALQGPFRGYADHMESPAFADAVRALVRDALRTPTAIMCAERTPCDCHRSLIADWLIAHGHGVVHLIDAGVSERGRLSPLARLVQSRLVYDLGVQAPLL